MPRQERQQSTTDIYHVINDMNYDGNGALTRDGNRGIKYITYDYSHYPSHINMNIGKRQRNITNDYTPDGRKLSSVKKTHIYNAGGYTSITTTDLYVDGLLLRNAAPLMWRHDGGYVELDANGTPTSWNYYVTDHLGSTRMVVDSNDSIRETINYYPFGSEMQMVNPALLTNALDHPFRFTGKELVRLNGLNQYDFGARWYDVAGVPMWTSVDPLAEKYYNVTPYSYCLGNPVSYFDEHGDSCIVLLAPDGANGFGHMAIGIQNEKGEWCLYSKNGTNQNFGTYGKEPPIGDKKHNDRGEKKADNLYDFLHDTSINPIDDNNKPEYTEGFLIPTTPKQDEKMKEGALFVINQDYDVLVSNCAQTVQRALKSGGLNSGNGLIPKTTVYPSIVKKNKGAEILIYNPQLSHKEW